MTRGTAMALLVLAIGLLGGLAATGHWPGGAALQRFEPDGILAGAGAATQVEITAGGGRLALRREGAGWTADAAAAEAAGQDAALSRHVETALRFLAVSAPLRVIGPGEVGAGGLAAFGLDPPAVAVSLLGGGGAIARIGFGAANPAGTSDYVRVEGRPEVYLLPRHVGAEWRLAADRAHRVAAGAGSGEAGTPLLPVSLAQVWAAEIVAGGTLVRFERDQAGDWFRHVGQHVHRNPADAHRADPEQARRIAAEFAAFEHAQAARDPAAAPDAPRTGLARPGLILLLYARDNPEAVARLDIGGEAADGAHRYARLHAGGPVVAVARQDLGHLDALLGMAAP